MTQQWIGNIQTPDGSCMSMLCIDRDRPSEAMIHWWGQPDQVPAAALVEIDWSGQDQATLVPKLLYGPRPENGEIWLVSAQAAQDADFLGYRGKMRRLKNGALRGEWTHKNGQSGKFSYSAPPAPAEGITATVCKDWQEFKEWATKSRENLGATLFRGHGSNQFRLTTTLHRSGHSRLERYCRETLQQFRAHAEAVLGFRFDMSNGDDYSMLLGLAQHHGLPTPLLDWTRSPYIAAFFAFADALELGSTRPNTSHVRIYGLTSEFINQTSPNVVTIPLLLPYVCTLSFSARNNPRLYAQQGQFLVTNIADLERYLTLLQKKARQTLLVAADVPVDCARTALADLAFMGLTAASMFPGLDGVCRMMKHEMSFKRPVERPTTTPRGGISGN